MIIAIGGINVASMRRQCVCSGIVVIDSIGSIGGGR